MKLNRIFYLLFYLFIFLNSNSCKREEFNQVNSNSTNKDSLLLKKYLSQANLQIEKNQNDSAKYFTSKLLNIASSNQNNYYLGKSHAIYGYLFLVALDNDSAYYHLNEAKDNFLKINDSLNVGKNLTNMAIIQSNQGDYSGSEAVATEALNFVKNKNRISFKSSIFNCLAISSFNLDNYSESIYWYKKAIETNEDSFSQALYKNNLAVSYLFEKDYSQSIIYLSELINDSISHKSPDLKSKVIDNLAFTRWKQNPEMNVERELNEALKVRIENDDHWGQIASHAHLSDYFSNKNQNISLDHAHKMYQKATEVNSPDDRLEALQKLITLESSANSKKYSIQYVSINDSLVAARNQAKDKFAKIRYDSEKNREENEILRAETAEQQLEIERRKLYGVISISGIILICGGFLGFNRIQKIKNQKKINDEIHATEIKISGKVHDDIANNLYGVMSLIERDNEIFEREKQNLILEKLDEVYQLSRNISRENSQIETGENYPEELLNLFSNFKNDKTNVFLIGFTEEPWKNIKSEIKLQFYKVVQELLINMKKHSQATVVVLKFEFNENKLNFFYTDNGIGITENQMIKKNGIQITENRIEKIKGTISFVAEPNKGLKVNIMIPL